MNTRGEEAKLTMDYLERERRLDFKSEDEDLFPRDDGRAMQA